ncbi:MAG: hypothetical protein JW837_12850 [Sedimentisphaerales bacterium]|nr:hypothetical protein [Sedimentisphaerales bacterium]
MFNKIKLFPHNLIFILFSMLYLWLVIEPHLIYQCFGTILPNANPFTTGIPFLKNSLNLPGGFVAYVSGFLSQGFYYSWLGAVIIVVLALCLSELYRRHLMASGHTPTTVLTSVPAIIIFLIYSHYKHPLPACLTVSLGLLCSLIFEKIPLRKSLIRVIVYCLMAAVIFWLSGAGGLLVFLLMTLIYGIFTHRDWKLTILAPFISVAIIWGLNYFLFLLPPQNAFLILTPVSTEVTAGMNSFLRALIIALYGFASFSVLLLFLGGVVFSKNASTHKEHSKQKKAKKKHNMVGQKKPSLTIFKKLAVTAIPIVLLAAGLYFTYDRMSKPFVLTNNYALHKQWDNILNLARTLPRGKSNVYFNHDIDRALYHTGRLPYDLFCFPQSLHGLLLTHEKKESYLTQLKLCDIFIELGQLNTAERLASEILATKGQLGIVVEKLVWIKILKGQTDSARIYLNALKKNLLYRRTAETLLIALDSGFTPKQTVYIDSIRANMLDEDHSGISKESVEQLLIELLDHNPENKMAFEYLMACYLLTGQVDKIAANMERLLNLGYKAAPTLYQEAMLIHFGSQGQKVDLKKLNINPDTYNRYIKFVQLKNTMKTHNRQVILRNLVTEFGNSYFFYFTFGRVGLS